MRQRSLLVLCLAIALNLAAPLKAEDSAITIPHSAGTTTLPAPAKRVVTLEHRYSEFLLSLGVIPVGMADPEGYRRHVSLHEPGLAQTTSVGTKTEPSVEQIFLLEPDLIIGTGFRHSALYPTLSQIAPTVLLHYTEAIEAGNANGAETGQLARMLFEFKTVARALGQEERAAEIIEGFKQKIEASPLSGIAKPQRPTAIYLQFLPGSKRFRWFSSQSIPGSLLQEAGWRSLDPEHPGSYDFAVLSYSSLPKLQADRIFFTFKGGRNNFAALESSVLWLELGEKSGGHLHQIPNGIWPFGGPESAMKFLDALYKSERRHNAS